MAFLLSLIKYSIYGLILLTNLGYAEKKNWAVSGYGIEHD